MANSSLLDEPAVRERMSRFSVQQYQLLGKTGIIGTSVELLEGIIVKKMPKSPRHEFFAAALAKMLEKSAPPDFLVRKEAPLTCRDSEPEPDVALVRGTLADFLDVHPSTAELVIEVALTSLEIDYRKRKIYAAAKVPEYWIVRPETCCLEVYTLPFEESYTATKIYTPPQVVASEVLPAFELDLKTFFPR